MAKRESRQKSRQSVAIRGEDGRVKADRDTDRDTLRRMRELCEQAAPDRWYIHKRDILAILNGTDRDTQPLPDSHNTCLRMHPNQRSQASDSRPREH